jgi:hypothetical protein
MDYAVTVETESEQLIVAAQRRTTFKLVSKEIGALLSHPWAFIANSESRTKRRLVPGERARDRYAVLGNLRRLG